MPIPIPVTKTRISTTNWGIPITNEVNRLTPLVDNMGKFVYLATMSANYNLTATPSDITGLTATFTAIANHRYRLELIAGVVGGAVNDAIVMQLTDGANTTIRDSGVIFADLGGVGLDAYMPFIVGPLTAGSKTYKVRGYRFQGTGNCYVQQFSIFAVTDLGL